MRHRGWTQKEDRGIHGEDPARRAKLRPVNYAELFTDLSPSSLLLCLREEKSDGKSYRARWREDGKICRRVKREGHGTVRGRSITSWCERLSRIRTNPLISNCRRDRS